MLEKNEEISEEMQYNTQYNTLSNNCGGVSAVNDAKQRSAIKPRLPRYRYESRTHAHERMNSVD